MGCEAASEPCSSCATTANVGSTAATFDYARGSTAEANADVFAITGGFEKNRLRRPRNYQQSRQ